MKRFLVFCIIILVSVTIGYMTYYFIQDNEKMTIEVSYYQINMGEERVIEIERVKPKTTTEISYEVTDPTVISFDEATMKITPLAGGTSTINITTTNENIANLAVEVNVGDGSIVNPYFIRNITDLTNIGIGSLETGFTLSDSYRLTNDIILSDDWTPISGIGGFSGTFYGDFHTIKNVNVTNASAGSVVNAGLFDCIADKGIVQYLTVDSVNINGSFDNAGAVAGINYGNIKNCTVSNSLVVNLNNSQSSTVGGVVGWNKKVNILGSEAYISKVAVSATISGKGYVGGIAGRNTAGYIYNCFTTDLSDISSANIDACVGGIAGENGNDTDTFSVIKDCYNLATLTFDSTYSGGVVGRNVIDTVNSEEDKLINYIVGCYYLKSGTDTYFGVGSYDEDVDASLSTHILWDYGIMGVSGKTITELKIKSTFVSHKAKTGTEIISWNFTGAWSLGVNATPQINFDGGDVSIGLGTLNLGNSISTPEQFTTNFKNNGTYVVEQDIDLGGVEWTPLCAIDDGFRGTISGVWLEDEGRYAKIYNFVLPSADYAGFFSLIESKGSISNLGFDEVTTKNVDTGEYISVLDFGIVAGKNMGVVENIQLYGNNNIKTIAKSGSIRTYVGGIVGENYGSVTGAICNVGDIGAKSIGETAFQGMFIGGIVGKNVQSVSNCGITGGTVELEDIYWGAAGGIVGINTTELIGGITATLATVQSCYFTNALVKTSSLSEDRWSHFGGGVVGNLASGSVVYNYVSGSVQGIRVGGLVGICYANVNENMFEGEVVGTEVGGAICFTIWPAKVLNNYIGGVLRNVAGANSYKAAITAYARRITIEKAVCSNNFITCVYDNVNGMAYGEMGVDRTGIDGYNIRGFIDIVAAILGIPGDLYETCYGTNNVMNTSITKDYETFGIPVVDDVIYFVFGNEEALYMVTDVQAKGTGVDGYKVFRDAKYLDTIWNFSDGGEYPKLKNVVNVPTNDEFN